ncbi:MAG: Fe-S cluster assembly ATPase SufC [Candidatus Nomurabacteria bacterium]|jgi:Fe-S cluster assembly ATP-binding protein|nr:Fe-S cluster assembly ATPase SufC [Candidatus Nomurabacteria bacterium]
MTALKIDGLTVETLEGRQVLSELSLDFKVGKRYAILGPNGSGKSTLVNAILGHPHFRITHGRVLLGGKNITNLPTSEKAKLGLFLGFQYPVEIDGVSFSSFLRSAVAHQTANQANFFDVLSDTKTQAAALGFKKFDPTRNLNVGFSGGEKKRSEILQMLALKPKFAFLDEPDSGLDIDGISALSKTLNTLSFPTALTIITHHHRALEALQPDIVYVIKNGQLVATGGKELITKVQVNGFKGM